jgi:hypothetical protein
LILDSTSWTSGNTYAIQSFSVGHATDVGGVLISNSLANALTKALATQPSARPSTTYATFALTSPSYTLAYGTIPASASAVIAAANVIVSGSMYGVAWSAPAGGLATLDNTAGGWAGWTANAAGTATYMQLTGSYDTTVALIAPVGVSNSSFLLPQTVFAVSDTFDVASASLFY